MGSGLLFYETYLYPLDLLGTDPSVPFLSFGGLLLCLSNLRSWSDIPSSWWHFRFQSHLMSHGQALILSQSPEHCQEQLLEWGMVLCCRQGSTLRGFCCGFAKTPKEFFHALSTSLSHPGIWAGIWPKKQASGIIHQNFSRALSLSELHPKLVAFQVTH